MAKVEHPMQPIIWAKDGVIRFKSNPIVEYILDKGREHGIDLNDIALQGFKREDQEQFAQLIGYSVSGFGDLSYARATTVARADAIADKMVRGRQKQKRARQKKHSRLQSDTK